MIKTTKEVIGEVLASTENKEQILKNYAFSIVDECSGNFECYMEEDFDSDYGDPNRTFHPVLVRQSILDIKNQIK